ncbi:MAG: hypothetical protein PHT77_03005 [Bacteroidales bacterium]|nr:hypothetical protein [Bacteroidales bacterium]HPE86951.1 hypothetical protein [Bacteroidales bacterium]
MMLKVILISILLLALAVSALAIKMFVKKGGEFKKSCSSVHPETGERIGCSCGGGSNSCHNN